MKSYYEEEVENCAAALYDGGWRSEDREQIKEEYRTLQAQVGASRPATQAHWEICWQQHSELRQATTLKAQRTSTQRTQKLPTTCRPVHG